MRVILDSGRICEIGELSFTEWRRFMSEFMSSNHNASKAWDVMGCIRGPDYPSERPDMTSYESSAAYKARRKRKYNTVEVIRDVMFFGVVGGGARHHNDVKVIIAHPNKQDHFDRHVDAAARTLGLQVEYLREPDGDA